MAEITKAAVNDALTSFDWAEWQKKLLAIYLPIYRALVASQGTRTVRGKKAAKADAFSFDDPYTKKFMASYVAERIKQVDDTTREWVRKSVLDAFESDEGANINELASKLADVAGDSRAFSPERALMIARTETAIAYNQGAALGYKQAGIEQVEVSDGDGDDECAEADGQVWTIADALANPIAHPNCTRSFAPYVE